MTTSPQTLRLSINSSLFNSSPVRAIKQLIGPNAHLISYSTSSILTPSSELLVDVTFTSLPLSPFFIHYIPLSSIKQLIPNSEKYTATINSITVKLNNPKLTSFHDYLPVRIKPTIINSSTSYDSYYSTLDDITYTLSSSSPSSSPLSSSFSYFATTVTNPLNSLLTPLSLLSSSITSTSSFSFTFPLPNPLYPSSFTPPPSPYSLSDTISNYQQTLQTIPSLSLITTITHSPTFPTNLNPTMSSTAYLIPYTSLPTNAPLKGIILIQPKRIPSLILYYPTNIYTLSPSELVSIQSFVKADEINYSNYHYLKTDSNTKNKQ